MMLSPGNNFNVLLINSYQYLIMQTACGPYSNQRTLYTYLNKRTTSNFKRPLTTHDSLGETTSYDTFCLQAP